MTKGRVVFPLLFDAGGVETADPSASLGMTKGRAVVSLIIRMPVEWNCRSLGSAIGMTKGRLVQTLGFVIGA